MAGAPASGVQKASREVKKTVTPIRIEEARPINFARNLKDYRSPKLAMFLSLLVPGLGQVYVKSYVKAGIFVAAEAAIITASVVYMNKGKDKYNQATAFADRNYSTSKMLGYYDSLYAFLYNNMYGGVDSNTQSALNDIYYDTLTSSASSFLQGAKSKSHSYYQTIAEPEYIQGWKDCRPSITAITNGGALPAGYTVDTTNGYLVDFNGTPVYGYSDSLLTYKAMMAQYTADNRIATNILLIILVNHIASAVDALISAKAYDDNLLGKQTFWQHVQLEPGLASAGTLSGPALTLRITF